MTKEEIDERTARRLHESALAVCERLPAANQERLLVDFARQILQRIETMRSINQPRTIGIVSIEIK